MELLNLDAALVLVQRSNPFAKSWKIFSNCTRHSSMFTTEKSTPVASLATEDIEASFMLPGRRVIRCRAGSAGRTRVPLVWPAVGVDKWL